MGAEYFYGLSAGCKGPLMRLFQIDSRYKDAVKQYKEFDKPSRRFDPHRMCAGTHVSGKKNGRNIVCYNNRTASAIAV